MGVGLAFVYKTAYLFSECCMSTWRLIFPILIGFIISFLAQAVALAAACGPKFEDKLCVAEHAYARACKPLPDSYQHFRIEEQLYDLFQLSPEMVQLGFCRVEELRIVRKWGENSHSGFALGRQIVIDRTFLFEVADMPGDRAFRRVVFSFPGYTDRPMRMLRDFHEIEKRLFQAKPYVAGSSYEFKHFMLHELAHLVDFNFENNPQPNSGYFACEFAAQILHGKTEQALGYSSVFPEQFGHNVDSAIYKRLADSSISSFYGASWPTEDFAELFADYVLLEHFGINYTIEKDGEVLFDRAKQFENENIQNKLAIVKTVLAWPQMTDVERHAFMDDRTHCRGIFEPTLVQ